MFFNFNVSAQFDANQDIAIDFEYDTTSTPLKPIQAFLDIGGTYSDGAFLKGSGAAGSQVLVWGSGSSSDGKVFVDATDAASGTAEYLLDTMKDTGTYSANTDVLVQAEAIDTNNESMRLSTAFDGVSNWNAATDIRLFNSQSGVISWTTFTNKATKAAADLAVYFQLSFGLIQAFIDASAISGYTGTGNELLGWVSGTPTVDTLEDWLKKISGYNGSNNQVLTHSSGTMAWVDISSC